MPYWKISSTDSIAPLANGGAGPREFSEALQQAKGQEYPIRKAREPDLTALLSLLGSGALDLNSQWTEYELMGDQNKRQEEGWIFLMTDFCHWNYWATYNTPWHMTVLDNLNGPFELEKLLLKRGADINAYNGRGRTALHELIPWGWAAGVKFLCQNGVDVNKPSVTRSTSFTMESERTYRITKDWPAGVKPLQLAIKRGIYLCARC